VDVDTQITEVDPHDPGSEPLLHAMYEVSAAARSDRPFEVWAPWPTAHVTWTQHRTDQDDVYWAATLDGEVVGMAHLALPHLDNLHTAMADLFVHPDHRRRGIGTSLLAAVTERSRAGGRTVLMTAPYSPVDRPGPGEAFLLAKGFELGIAEMSRVCDLLDSEPTWDALAAEAAPRHTGYRLEPWQDRVPDALVPGYCEMGEAFISEAPIGELDLEDEVWSAERVTERDERFLATGRHQFGVLVYAADGTCVGSTELFVNEAASWRALQGGTLVVPGHRGHRLGLALKLANLRAVRARFPDCRYVFTAVAGVNAPMNAVNELLGFRDVERTLEMQLKI
jgi:GNAT superfamily N-acetyltransferase